ncbi:M24 family metallopeptidase [Acidobacteriota bacterium]
MERRDFLKLSTGAGAALVASSCSPRSNTKSGSSEAIFPELTPMTDGIIPITQNERMKRIEKAKRLMAENNIQAIYMESGTSMFYFTGVRWGNSERMFAVVIPVKGEVAWVCPAFELDRAHEKILPGTDIRTWEEHESPYKRVAEILKDRGIQNGKIGLEERARFFLFDGIRKAAPHLEYVSADPVTIGCRVIKSAAEIVLMQKANDITITAYKASINRLEKGMTSGDFRAISSAAHSALGASGGIGAQIAEASSNPHGSIMRIELKEGDIVLMDGGCNIDGYRSDISRTIVFGEPSQRQREMWNLAKKAQSAVFETAGIGVPCEDADAAARKVYVDFGFPGGYNLPGCPHRSGHGIGLDGHEWINLVKGNTTPMETGMCFTNEPMLVIPGEFGVRLEDDFYMTEEGPRYFTTPSPSIDQPIA